MFSLLSFPDASWTGRRNGGILLEIGAFVAFTENDLRDLLVPLQSDAGARQELRNLIRDPLLEVVQSEMAGLAAAQRRTEERLAELGIRMEELAVAQRRTEERMASLIERFD